MIDQDLLENMPADSRRMTELALKTLADSGVIKEQQRRLLAQLAAGADNESDTDLLPKIRQYRLQYQSLEALQLLGESFDLGDTP